MSSDGVLYVVATPIGNLEDVSLRAIATLQEVDFIACEDTRRTRKLFTGLNLSLNPSKLITLADFSSANSTATVVRKLRDGHDVALITDAGTPAISDPGFDTVRKVGSLGIRVVPLPGASALSTLLSISPIPANDFRFVGFLKTRHEQRLNQLNDLLNSPIPIVFFESPKRLLGLLRQLIQLGAGTRSLFVGRELTKIHEEHLFDTVEGLLGELEDRTLLGEFTCILAAEESRPLVATNTRNVVKILREEQIRPSSIAKLVAKLCDVDRKTAYRYVVELNERGESNDKS